jgi:hypothetical protein
VLRKLAFYTKIIKPKEMGYLEELRSDRTLAFPDWWRDGDSLRCLYKNEFDLNKTKILVKKFSDFVGKILSRNLKNVTLGFIVY